MEFISKLWQHAKIYLFFEIKKKQFTPQSRKHFSIIHRKLCKYNLEFRLNQKLISRTLTISFAFVFSNKQKKMKQQNPL